MSEVLRTASGAALPPLRSRRAAPLPTVAERVLDNGLRVLAVRRAGVPMVEVRLRVPGLAVGAAASVRRGVPLARATLLAETLLAGTSSRTQVQLAEALQAVGGGLSAGVDADRLGVVGSALSTGAETLLELLAEVLTDAQFPGREVGVERGRLAHELEIARTQPGTLAHEALLRRLYGGHPYGRDLPPTPALRGVTPAQLRVLHAERVVPQEALLVLVGDVAPRRLLDLAEGALGGWRAAGAAPALPEVPELAPGPVVLVDRPGSVQTAIRIGGPALPRHHPQYAALQLANLVFGGYFSSRLVANLREAKGYTYSPHSLLEHPGGGSRVVVDLDVATEVTAPALVETWYELGRVATQPVTADELGDARRYAVGTLALSTATQAGLASTLSMLTAAGLPVQWLRDHPRALERVGPDDVLAAAAAHLAPGRLVTVLVGDAARIRDSVSALAPVVDAPQPE